MKLYEEKKEYLLKLQEFKCASCNHEFKAHDKIDLAHKLKASKKNYELFSELVIDHVNNLAATHSGDCNDAQNCSRASNPVRATEIIIEILTHLIQGEPDTDTIYILKNAFNNLIECNTDSHIHIGMYDILANFFEAYQDYNK